MIGLVKSNSEVAVEVIEGLLEAMKIQEKRETGEFHLSPEAAFHVWNEAKVKAQDFLQGKYTKYIKIEKGNDWGTIYYTPEGKTLTPSGCANHRLGFNLVDGIAFKAQWPDGEITSEVLVSIQHIENIYDHGSESTIMSRIFGVRKKIMGVPIFVELSNLAVPDGTFQIKDK